MKQRNDTGYPVPVAALGRDVEPGETVDVDELLAGFTKLVKKSAVTEVTPPAPTSATPDPLTDSTPAPAETTEA